MDSAPRLELAKVYWRKLFTLEGLGRLATRPSVVVDFVRYQLFDVKLRSSSPEAQLRIAAGTLSALANISRVCGPAIVADALPTSDAEGAACRELEALFVAHGSDKSTLHDYHILYSTILRGRRSEPLKILEIGLGTNHLDTPSNMGLKGRPGASLRAFRDWAPNATVYGADVDRRILFSEERIRTFHVDQTQPATLEALAASFEAHSFDLIIDDGLHTSEANLNTLLFALPLLKNNGTLVIEDVYAQDLPAWQIAFGLLEARYSCRLYSSKDNWVVVVRAGKNEV